MTPARLLMADNALTLFEKALAAYIRDARDAASDDATSARALSLECERAGDLNGVPVHEGRQEERMQSPLIQVRALSSERPIYGASFRLCRAEVLLYTSRQEDSNDTASAEVLFNARVGALDALLCDEDALRDALSKPPSGAVDGRNIVGIDVPLIWLSGESLAADKDTWQQTFEVSAHVEAFDRTNI